MEFEISEFLFLPNGKTMVMNRIKRNLLLKS
jgi:hypothetical protein